MPLARNLALELARYRIRVNAVCPGIIETPLSFRQAEDDPAAWEKFFARFAERIPLRRVGQPEDVAATVAFLASDDARISPALPSSLTAGRHFRAGAMLRIPPTQAKPNNPPECKHSRRDSTAGERY